MNKVSIRPKTLVGIKSLAKTIKKRDTIQYCDALNLAAKQAGFGSFWNAQRILSKKGDQSPRAVTYISARWFERNTKDRGHVVLEFRVDNPVLSSLSQYQIDSCRYLSTGKVVANDHLVLNFSSDSKDAAREEIARAARAIQFMSATGLRPTRARNKYLHKSRYENRPSFMDHETPWVDPNTRQHILVNEPYEGNMHSRQTERNAWKEKYGFELVESSWKGIYFPYGGTRMELISYRGKGVPLGPIKTALERINKPLDAAEADWLEFGPGPYFESPEEQKTKTKP